MQGKQKCLVISSSPISQLYLGVVLTLVVVVTGCFSYYQVRWFHAEIKFCVVEIEQCVQLLGWAEVLFSVVWTCVHTMSPPRGCSQAQSITWLLDHSWGWKLSTYLLPRWFSLGDQSEFNPFLLWQIYLHASIVRLWNIIFCACELFLLPWSPPHKRKKK